MINPKQKKEKEKKPHFNFPFVNRIKS